MKARIKGCNDPFQEIIGVALCDGNSYSSGVVEFEDECATDWNELRNKAAIAAMQGLISHQKGYIEAIRFSREISVDTGNILACTAVEYADALIKKLKGE